MAIVSCSARLSVGNLSFGSCEGIVSTLASVKLVGRTSVLATCRDSCSRRGTSVYCLGLTLGGSCRSF